MSLEFDLLDTEHAFRLLEFSIRVLNYFELDQVNLNTFGQETLIRLPTGDVTYRDSYFTDQRNSTITANISVSASFGVSAIALDDLFEATGRERIPDSPEEFQQVWSLVYAIRNAYAHGIAAPVWDVKPFKGKPRPVIRLSLGGRDLVVDPAALHGKEFDYAQIGGLKNWLLLKDKAVSLVSSS